MKILIVGGDSRGSWQMRGVQLGRVLGARATLTPSVDDWAWADLVVLVKRAAVQYADQARRVDVPVVWDALDFWAQPEDNGASLSDHVARATAIAARARVDLVIGATQAMADDLGGVYLPHHCRLGLIPTRPRGNVVGYDGTKKYLGPWASAIATACEAIGWQFVINPSDLRGVGVLVAFRDGAWDGDVCRRWKSGVKAVNAIASGRPMLSQPCASADELLPMGVTVRDIRDLAHALEIVTSPAERDRAYEDGRKRARDFTVEAVADTYLSILSVASKVAA